MKKKIFMVAVSIIIVSVFIFTPPAFAEWGKIGNDVRITNDSAASSSPSLVWTGTEYGVVWHDPRDGNYEIYFARISASGIQIGSDMRITNFLSFSTTPSLVWIGTEYGVSWRDDRDGNYEIYFARIDSSGNKIASDVRLTNDIEWSWDPSLVWTGIEYGVAWMDRRNGAMNPEIYFTRINASGVKIGSDVRITWIGRDSSRPSLVWNGVEYGLSWQDEGLDDNYEIYFARLDSSGNKIGVDTRITNDSGYSGQPSLVWIGTEYGVSWRDDRDGNYEIYFARIDTLGNKIGTDIRITNNSAISGYPSLVWNDSEYGVSWSDPRDGNYEIYFARIDALGNKISADIRITNDGAVSASGKFSLVWTGTEYGVAWYDNRDGNNEIYFARIGQSGQGLIPTLSEWGLIILGVMMLTIIIWRIRQQYVRV